jgi:general stress protein 26
MPPKKTHDDTAVSAEKKLDDLYALIDGVEVAMMTTRRADGLLVSRPMATQRRTAGTDLWFMTNRESAKFEDLALDPHVNVCYFKDRTREWVSVSGTAILSQDRDLVDALYSPDWRTWLGDQGGKYDAGPRDPRIALILVEALAVTYGKKDRSTPMVLFEMARGIVTGRPPTVADVRDLGEAEIRAAKKRGQSGDLRTGR